MFLSLSSRSDYGFLMMTMLADAKNDLFIRVPDIARTKHIPVAYASQIMAALRKAELVESKEGVGGGYRLARPAETISLKEIVEALDGKIAPVKCMAENHPKCPCEPGCTMKPIWKETVDLVNNQLSNKKLSDLMQTGS